MKMTKRLAFLSVSLFAPGIALAHAGHLDTIEHAVLHMLEHNGKEIGAVLLALLAVLVGLYVTNSKNGKTRSITKDKK